MNDIERTVADVTAAYRAGMGLPALQKDSGMKYHDCEECHCILEEHEGDVCEVCHERLLAEQKQDERLDDPRHVAYSNLRRK